MPTGKKQLGKNPTNPNLLARSEGIIPALECAHALAWIVREASSLQGNTVLMNLSGRGDKDVAQMMDILAR